MRISDLLQQIKAAPDYRGQIVYTREVAAREARYADPSEPLPDPAARMLSSRGMERLYSHQAQAVDAFRAGEDIVIATGTASGKSLCYIIPIVEALAADPAATALLLFPTKALTQDQFKGFSEGLRMAGMEDVLCGVHDGDTPAETRRKLRDEGRVIFTNPDMLHASMMPQHGRWADFLANLKILVIDELHVYSGIFGSNMANLMQRFFRVCGHYGSSPRVIACSATIANPGELGAELTGRPMRVIDDDGSPRGKRTYVLWNPPRQRGTIYRSRRSANVEAHELMARLIRLGMPTITFSKAKMTAEMIYRYVCEKLQQEAPELTGRVTPYRGGYLPEQRREIERRLFAGELLGVSTTRALELGIDVGGLDACILVGYPGTLASFFQQAGRAGRGERESLIILVGLDTAINQYVMTNPEYLFGRPIERAVIDEHNPYVITGHLRCAVHELPLPEEDSHIFGRHAPLALDILQENQKVRRIDGTWYHASTETPQHEISLRDYADYNVVIEDIATGAILGEVNKFDAPPILHPHAIYMHQGDTYIVRELDLQRNIARVERIEVDYYTQPLGGTDVHHVDHRLREKPFGTGRAYWGEVTAYFRNWGFERVHFYSLDAIDIQGLDLPTMQLETMALWMVPPEPLMHMVRTAGLDAHSGLRGVGYATRMLLPTFMTCDTLDFSHSIGSANSEWNAIFIYERYPLGLGFTEKAYDLLHEILPAVYENVRSCECAEGCPCCVGKPLRGYSTWNVERGEASVPSKKSALIILEGYLDDMSNLSNPDVGSMTDSEDAMRGRLERSMRRRLERMREPSHFHPIDPLPRTEYPSREAEERLAQPDVAARKERRGSLEKDLRKRLAKRLPTDRLDALAPRAKGPEPLRTSRSLPPIAFTGRPEVQSEQVSADSDAMPPPHQEPIEQGDSLAARARRLKKQRKQDL